jgi:hypothetical protein
LDIAAKLMKQRSIEFQTSDDDAGSLLDEKELKSTL